MSDKKASYDLTGSYLTEEAKEALLSRGNIMYQGIMDDNAARAACVFPVGKGYCRGAIGIAEPVGMNSQLNVICKLPTICEAIAPRMTM